MRAGDEIIGEYMKGLRSCLDEIAEEDIRAIVDIIMKAYSAGKKLVFLGNGGSAATASHFARDLSIGTAKEGKPRVRAISLTDNIVAITSLANDVGYNSIFKEQLAGQVDKGDVVIGISASGNSPNVLEAMGYARSVGAVTVGFIGFGGGKLKELTDKAIVLSCQDYGQVEDAHLVLDHILTGLVKERIAVD
jgi:D-sedoheptulose 7-phosphate isomerase